MVFQNPALRIAKPLACITEKRIMKELDYCICYYAEQNRKGIALNLLTFGYVNFTKAVHVEKITELENFVNNPDFRKQEYFIANVQKFAFENLLDAIKICICFENYMKAKLLLNDFVIHKIIDGPDYESLRKEQNKRPIELKEIKAIESWKKVDNQDLYYLPGLTDKTLQFNIMLNKPKYQRIIGLPVKAKDIISKLNDQRNTLHFLTGEIGTYGKERVEELKTIIEFVETELFILQNQLVDDLNLSKEKKLKRNAR